MWNEWERTERKWNLKFLIRITSGDSILVFDPLNKERKINKYLRIFLRIIVHLNVWLLFIISEELPMKWTLIIVRCVYFDSFFIWFWLRFLEFFFYWHLLLFYTVYKILLWIIIDILLFFVSKTDDNTVH
jgi:hypothetical protein